MAVAMVTGTATSVAEAATPLLDDVVEGSVDFKGRLVNRTKSGGWRSAGFIICVEIAERFAYYGITSNLINYLTGPLGQTTAAAAANVNAWSGTASLLPLLGAFVADSFLGRYRTILVSSLLYILALGLLTLSAILPVNSSDCQKSTSLKACSPPGIQILFFFSLYLVASAQGGHKPCVQAFGADQFNDQDPEERKAKSSFFNWWYFGMCGGNVVTISVLNYIQDNLGWGLGFGIPCIALCLSLSIFLLGTKTYRFCSNNDKKSPFARIGLVFVNAFKNRKASLSISIEGQEKLLHQGSEQFKFLDRALLPHHGLDKDGNGSSVSEVEEVKGILNLFPIWATCLAYAVVFAQPFTLFTKQGVTMDRSLSVNFQVPSASLQSFINVSIVFFIPIYDRILVPTSRVLTGNPSGISMLQRIGTGILLSILCMVTAAVVERRRLIIAREFGLIDEPDATVPMKVWWLIPQYLLFGLSELCTMVGLQEFFYSQMPSELRSIGLALYLSIFGVGSYLSSFLISLIQKTTGGEGRDGWIANNLNRGHLDYFYWLLAGVSVVAFIAYLHFAKSYTYKKVRAT